MWSIKEIDPNYVQHLLKKYNSGRGLRITPKEVNNDYKNTATICRRRLRAERKGLPTDQFPPRQRRSKYYDGKMVLTQTAV